MNRSIRFILLASVALFYSTTSSLLKADLIEYSLGHGDVGMAIETDGSLFLHYHFGTGSVLDGVTLTGDAEYAPSEVYVRVGDAAQRTITNSNVTTALGITSGSTAWVLPASNNPLLPFLGIAAEELSAPLTNPQFRLVNYSYSGAGSGNFALWDVDGDGNFIFFFRTNDGLGVNDVFNSSIGGHAHANWGFSSLGVYDITLEASVFDPTLNGGTTLTDTGTFRFVVGSATAVPEPSSMVLLATGSALAAWRVRRKRRSQECERTA